MSSFKFNIKNTVVKLKYILPTKIVHKPFKLHLFSSIILTPHLNLTPNTKFLTTPNAWPGPDPVPLALTGCNSTRSSPDSACGQGRTFEKNRWGGYVLGLTFVVLEHKMIMSFSFKLDRLFSSHHKT